MQQLWALHPLMLLIIPICGLSVMVKCKPEMPNDIMNISLERNRNQTEYGLKPFEDCSEPCSEPWFKSGLCQFRSFDSPRLVNLPRRPARAGTLFSDVGRSSVRTLLQNFPRSAACSGPNAALQTELIHLYHDLLLLPGQVADRVLKTPF